MDSLAPKIFCNPKVQPRGWYWALPSRSLKKGRKSEMKIFGETLLLYRGESGKPFAIEAFCPHMGAHLKEGSVEGDSIRCGFHGWKFSTDGRCEEMPCNSAKIDPASIRARKTFLAAERYGMIWLHNDPKATHHGDPLPTYPDLAHLRDDEIVARVDRAEIRNCHPTLILGGGVDEEHFLFVHRKNTAISGPLSFHPERISPTVIRYRNRARITGHSAASRFMSWLYRGVLKYDVTYWYASTALAELGPPILPLYSIFAYRPTADGRTEGLNIYITPKRRGPLGALISQLALYFTRKILRKGGGEDAVIQNSIHFNPSSYAFQNAPFRTFVEYVESQPAIAVGPAGKES